MDRSSRTQAIATALDDALQGLDVVIDDLLIQPAGKRRLVRVTVVRDVSDRLDIDDTGAVEPLTLDEVADASRAVDDALEAGDLMGSTPYTLEVSSPGVDQPLTTPQQYRRNVGRLLEIERVDGSRDQGRLLAVGPETIRVGDPPQVLRWSEVGTAHVQIEFTRPDTGKDI